MHGEIYHVDGEFLARLDYFEGHPHLYQREVIAVCITSHAKDEGSKTATNVTRDKPEVVRCSTYLQKNFNQSLLKKETFSSYDSLGSHGRSYMPE